MCIGCQILYSIQMDSPLFIELCVPMFDRSRTMPSHHGSNWTVYWMDRFTCVYVLCVHVCRYSFHHLYSIYVSSLRNISLAVVLVVLARVCNYFVGNYLCLYNWHLV